MQFDWLTAVSPIIPEPGFCQIWAWWLNISKDLSFHSRLFPRETANDFFQKIGKAGRGAILDPCWPNLAKNGFSWIKGFCQFLDIRIIYCHPKIRKNYWAIFEMKAKLTDGRTDRQTDRKHWFYRTLHRTGVQWWQGT